MELCSSINRIQYRMDHVEERTDHNERQMENYSKAFNEMVDAHDSHTEELQHFKSQLVDVEDSSKKNNIKFRGIPEIVKNSDLTSYLQQFLKLLPSRSPSDLIISWAQRIIRPKHLPTSVPRDILAHIQFFFISKSS